MRITHFTPGTGHFICGSCLRDNALVAALRRREHDVTMVPLYLPFALEDGPSPRPDRVFMGGINMYLQQKLPLFRRLPGVISRRLDSPRLLRWASTKGDMTDAASHGAMMVSTLRGECGRQAHEVDELVRWTKSRPRPDVLCLSNVMLIGMARRLKEETGAGIVCTLQGEAPFLDALPEPYRSEAWATITERAADVDAFVPVTHHYGELMRGRIGVAAERMHVVYNGLDASDVDLSGDLPPRSGARGPVIGYLARMCPDKGLHTLVEAFIRLKRDGAIDGLRLHAAGVMLEPDRHFVDGLRRDLDRAGFADDAAFSPNVARLEKHEMLRSISVLSVPATYGESFGLYLLEALAFGVPVVQPRHGAFPELLEATGGGLLCEPDDPESLAEGIRRLLEDEDEARRLAECGRTYVRDHLTSDHMACGFEKVCMMVASCPTSSG